MVWVHYFYKMKNKNKKNIKNCELFQAKVEEIGNKKK